MEKEFDERLKRDLRRDAEPLPVSYTERIETLLKNLPDNKKRQAVKFHFGYAAAVVCIFLLMASGAHAAVKVWKDMYSDNSVSEHIVNVPSEKKIDRTREEIFKGLKESDRKAVIDKIKYYNLAIEHAYLWDNLFQKMKDSDNLHWNLLYEKGEVQIGWAFETGEEYNPEKTKLSESEYNKKYGQKVTCHNEITADDFIKEMRNIQQLFKNEAIQSDFEAIIENMKQAKRTRDVEYLINIYRILHDMDYYLFRDKGEIEEYLKDTSLIDEYYGVLEVYR